MKSLNNYINYDARWTKLEGVWCVKVHGSVLIGDELVVKTKNNKRSKVLVTDIIHRDTDGNVFCATKNVIGASQGT